MVHAHLAHPEILRGAVTISPNADPLAREGCSWIDQLSAKRVRPSSGTDKRATTSPPLTDSEVFGQLAVNAAHGQNFLGGGPASQQVKSTIGNRLEIGVQIPTRPPTAVPHETTASAPET